MSKKSTTSKEVNDNPPRPMTDAEVLAAALSDPDAQPLTPTDFARMKRVPQVKVIRRALHLTQEEFSERYRIPLGTLRDWEQGRSEPDQTARAHLHAIAAGSDPIARALDQTEQKRYNVLHSFETEPSTMSSKRDYHVVPNPSGGWDVRREGGERSSGHFDRKSDAMERGRDLARENRTELVEHGRDGRIRDSDSYGNDPNPPRDRKH